MIIAGNCLYIDYSEKETIIETAKNLVGVADYFRVKIFGGGTRTDRYYSGIGMDGLKDLETINDNIIPTGTEIHTPEQLYNCSTLDYLWIGARNCQNYSLLESINILYPTDKKILIKRHPGMTIDEMIGIFDIVSQWNDNVYMIERGINTFDRLYYSRWAVDLKGVIRLKHERPDIFNRLVIDVSHSTGVKEWIADTYSAFLAIGVEHFMFECSVRPEESKTDKDQILSIRELKDIIGGLLVR